MCKKIRLSFVILTFFSAMRAKYTHINSMLYMFKPYFVAVQFFCKLAFFMFRKCLIFPVIVIIYGGLN